MSKVDEDRMRELAKEYVGRGWSVLPVKGLLANDDREAKKPAVKRWTELQSRRLTDEEIDRHNWSGEAIGVIAGEISGNIVGVDVDGELGKQSAKGLYSPATVVSNTPRGGIHLWYVNSSGIRLKPDSSILPGIDLRTDGSYLVAPPSKVPSGKCYEWRTGCSPDDTEMAEVPFWVILTSVAKTAKAAVPQWVLDLAQGVAEGERNTNGAKLIGWLLGPGRQSEHGARELLAAWNRENFPAMDDREVNAIADSIVATHKASHVWPVGAGSAASGKLPKRDDIGNARRFVWEHGDDIRWCKPHKKHYVWNGKCWKLDQREHVMKMAKKTARNMFHDAANINDADERKAFIKHAERSQSKRLLDAMVDVAKPDMAIVPEEFDTDYYLLNCENCTIELTTQQGRDHRREDYITKIAPVEFTQYDGDDGKYGCPRWEQFMEEITGNDPELMNFLQQAVGYSLTGDTSEQVYFFLWGTGHNGKSTFLNVIMDILGDYAGKTVPGTLVKKNSDRHLTELAYLEGLRFLVTEETEQGRRVDEQLVKQFASTREALTVRKMYGDPYQMRVTWKLWMQGNHKLEIRGQDEGIWRRTLLVPFTQKFEGAARIMNMEEILLKEADGILRWALDGCSSWMQHHLQIPSVVRDATAQYRHDEDVIGRYMEDRWVLDPEGTQLKDQGTVTPEEMYRDYKEWCEATNEYLLKKGKFEQRLKDKGYEKKKRVSQVTGTRQIHWVGMTLSSEPWDG